MVEKVPARASMVQESRQLHPPEDPDQKEICCSMLHLSRLSSTPFLPPTTSLSSTFSVPPLLSLLGKRREVWLRHILHF